MRVPCGMRQQKTLFRITTLAVAVTVLLFLISEQFTVVGDPFLWVLTPMATAPMATVPRKASPTWCTPCGTSWVIEECEEDGKLIRKMELDSTKAAHLVGRLEDVCGPIEPSPNHSAH